MTSFCSFQGFQRNDEDKNLDRKPFGLCRNKGHFLCVFLYVVLPSHCFCLFSNFPGYTIGHYDKLTGSDNAPRKDFIVPIQAARIISIFHR